MLSLVHVVGKGGRGAGPKIIGGKSEPHLAVGEEGSAGSGTLGGGTRGVGARIARRTLATLSIHVIHIIQTLTVWSDWWDHPRFHFSIYRRDYYLERLHSSLR